jgi:hypothetical protein
MICFVEAFRLPCFARQIHDFFFIEAFRFPSESLPGKARQSKCFKKKKIKILCLAKARQPKQQNKS